MTTLHHLVPIKASPEKVYTAVATGAGNRGWWTADSVVEQKVGRKAEFGFEKRAVVFRMTVDKLEPNREVVMSCHGDAAEWNGTTLEWKIDPTPDGALLRFTHRGWRDATDYCIGCNSMWGNLMFRLKTFVETGKPNPQWAD